MCADKIMSFAFCQPDVEANKGRFKIGGRFRQLVIRHQDKLKFGKNKSASARSRTGVPEKEIGFDHFEVLRAIGRGAFGKVGKEGNLSSRAPCNNMPV